MNLLLPGTFTNRKPGKCSKQSEPILRQELMSKRGYRKATAPADLERPFDKGSGDAPLQ